MRHLLAVVPALFIFGCSIFGCSIMDPGDRAELRKQIAMLPPDETLFLKKVRMNANALNWLRGKEDNEQMGKLQCRLQAGGVWSDWHDEEPTYLVFDMRECLTDIQLGLTYIMCKDMWVGVNTQAKINEILHEKQVPGVNDVQCRFVWDFRFEPEKVPANLIDPDKVTIDDSIDTLLRLPAPPPGWNLPQLVPLLCPLGAGPGWGCPGTPTDPTGDQPGDHP